MTARAQYTQAQIRRAIQAARKEGLPIAGVCPDGTVIIGEARKIDIPALASSSNDAASSKWEDVEA